MKILPTWTQLRLLLLLLLSPLLHTGQWIHLWNVLLLLLQEPRNVSLDSTNKKSQKTVFHFFLEQVEEVCCCHPRRKNHFVMRYFSKIVW